VKRTYPSYGHEWVPDTPFRTLGRTGLPIGTRRVDEAMKQQRYAERESAAARKATRVR
jgi:hypothetical protein